MVYTVCFENNYNICYREFESYIICIQNKILMGQKINATGLRLKKKVNWNALFCTHNLQSYANVVIDAHQTGIATNLLLSKINYFANNLYITRDSKKSHISSKILQKQNIYKNTKLYQLQTGARAQALLATTVANRQLSFVNKDINYQFWDLMIKKTQNKKLNMLGKENNVNFSLLSPKLISSYICSLLNKNTKTNVLNTSNLNIGIPMFLTRLLVPFKNTLLGVKIICSGKWKKTRSGRKQKLCIKYGKVRNPSVSNVILFDYTTQKTKFGACGIKVWVSHKK